MTAPTRWRDALGREWWRDINGYLRTDGIAQEFAETAVRLLCGPLVPVEPMARVRTHKSIDALQMFAGTSADDRTLGDYYASRAGIWPIARAEEIAAAFRTLGYADATVEVIE